MKTLGGLLIALTCLSLFAYSDHVNAQFGPRYCQFTNGTLVLADVCPNRTVDVTSSYGVGESRAHGGELLRPLIEAEQSTRDQRSEMITRGIQGLAGQLTPEQYQYRQDRLNSLKKSINEAKFDTLLEDSDAVFVSLSGNWDVISYQESEGEVIKLVILENGTGWLDDESITNIAMDNGDFSFQRILPARNRMFGADIPERAINFTGTITGGVMSFVSSQDSKEDITYIGLKDAWKLEIEQKLRVRESSKSLVDMLSELQKLYDAGMLSDEEFNKSKRMLFGLD